MLGFMSTVTTQWKGVLALTGALTVGVAGGAYMTLPRAVGEIADEQKSQGAQLDQLVLAVQGNTRAIRLVSCVQSANMLAEKRESQRAVQGCILLYGIVEALPK